MKCNQCNAEFEGKFCPECGARAEETTSTTPPSIQQSTQPQEQPVPPVQMNTVPAKKSKKSKKPIYKKWWFYAIIAVALIAIVAAFSGGSKSEKIKWDDMILGAQLPEPPANKGEIHENSADELWIDINNISDKQYNDYIEACKGKGFTVDAKSDSTSYDAYNAEGYKLSLGHYGSNDEMKIELEKPLEMSKITWPTSKAGSQLPAPKSTTGKFSYEYDDNFFVYVGDTSKAEYDQYVADCSAKGFTVDYDKGDTYYRADNANGYHISLEYEGNNIMSISISAPDEESIDSTVLTTSKPSEATTNQAKTDKSSTQKAEKTPSQGGSKYEAIYNEYAQKIRDAAPSSSITELAEIANEGVSKMAEYMWTAKGTDGQYSTYEEWADKLMDVYMSEAQ